MAARIDLTQCRCQVFWCMDRDFGFGLTRCGTHPHGHDESIGNGEKWRKS